MSARGAVVWVDGRDSRSFLHGLLSNDVAALRTDGFDRAARDIDRADLAAGNLRHVDAPVRAGAQTVGAEQAAGRREPFQGPTLCDARGNRGRVASRLHRHPENLLLVRNKTAM